ncbi:MAG: PspA-associated protein PspAA [Propionibacteriaceae bacterium]
MIVRILGEGQWQLDDSVLPELNQLDDEVEKAVGAGDQQGLSAALLSLHDRVRALGHEVPDDALEDSDLILPATDATVIEVQELLNSSTEGLIPG